MNWVVYLFGGGLALFLGVGLVIAGVALAALPPSGWTSGLLTLCAAVGLLILAASAAPLSLWLWLIAFAASLWWLATERFERFEEQRVWTRCSVLVAWLAIAALELPYQWTPTIAGSPPTRLIIFGDSVTAGMGDEQEPTWPKLLAAEHRLDVRDYSRPGATARSMASIAKRTPLAPGVVVIEIGGNDLLRGGSSADFERDLDALLAAVSGPERRVILLELPLPPLCNGFGAAQRSLGAKYGALLVPKRLFAEIIAAEGLTTDSIHLSPDGHQRMADRIEELLGF
jgi:acyl-CoA thioesterase-1